MNDIGNNKTLDSLRKVRELVDQLAYELDDLKGIYIMKNLNSFLQYFGLFVLFAYVSLSLFVLL